MSTYLFEGRDFFGFDSRKFEDVLGEGGHLLVQLIRVDLFFFGVAAPVVRREARALFSVLSRTYLRCSRLNHTFNELTRQLSHTHY